MDKESYQPMTIGHVAKRGTKRAFFSILGAESGIGERGEQLLKQWRVFRKRKCNFSLNFLAFEPSIRIGLRSIGRRPGLSRNKIVYIKRKPDSKTRIRSNVFMSLSVMIEKTEHQRYVVGNLSTHPMA